MVLEQAHESMHMLRLIKLHHESYCVTQKQNSRTTNVYFWLSNEQKFMKKLCFEECLEKQSHLYTTDRNVICTTILGTIQQTTFRCSTNALII